MFDTKESLQLELQDIVTKMDKLRKFNGSMDFNAIESYSMKSLLLMQYSMLYSYRVMLEAKLEIICQE
jgi:hypothetical protein